MVWKRLFGGGSEPEGPNTQDAQPMDAVDEQLDAAFDWLDATTGKLQERGIGNSDGFNVDLATGRITFAQHDSPELEFRCEAVGTFNPAKQTWHWGWDHPSIPPSAAHSAEVVRLYGEKNGLDAFTTRQIMANEMDAWQFTALAGVLTDAAGTYRCTGDVEVFLTLYDLD